MAAAGELLLGKVPDSLLRQHELVEQYKTR